MGQVLNQIALPFYCEREMLGQEPINVISNVIFFIVAFVLWQKLKQSQSQDNKLKTLILLTVLIGIDSTLFHFFRTPVTLFLDALPIFIFILLFLYTFLAKTLKNHPKALLFTFLLAVFQTGLYIGGFREVHNASVRHLVNAFLFPLLLLLSYKYYSRQAKLLVFAYISYLFAIGLRFLEPAICASFPIGTHFTWHIFNALVIYFGVGFLLKVNKKSN